jgi:hypothetical protein
MTTRDRIDRLIDGTITPADLEILTQEIGSEAIRHILDGEQRLRTSIASATQRTTSPGFVDHLMATIRAMPGPPRWIRLITRWSLPGGLLLVLLGVSVTLAALPRGVQGQTGRGDALSDAWWRADIMAEFLRSMADVPVSAVIVGGMVVLAIIIAVRLDMARR